jgi:hypothetical protein
MLKKERKKLMNSFDRIISGTSCGFVGGATGATVLTGLGLVIAGGPIAAIGFGIGTIGGTATGVIAGNKLLEKVRDN